MMKEEESDILKSIEGKYRSQKQDPDVYLEGLLWSKPITYWDYVEVDTLLSLQKPRTTLEDESVFIMYHQVNELLFKMILHEIRQIAEKDDLSPNFFAERLNRISRYFDVLSSSFEIMQHGMEKEQYLKFRTTLTPASGFQSAQYRMIEICSTDLDNLIDARFKGNLPADSDVATKIDHLYWQAAGKNYTTGERSLTLQLFEERYKQAFIDLANRYKDVNLWAKYRSLPVEVQNDKTLLQAMRHFDHTVNITWVMAHYNAARHYLMTGSETKEATGGSDWRKYMHPKYQRRIFFPGVWTDAELENWGQDQPI